MVLAPEVGFEPTTKALTAPYSTAELFGNVKLLVGYAGFEPAVSAPPEQRFSLTKLIPVVLAFCL